MEIDALAEAVEACILRGRGRGRGQGREFRGRAVGSFGRALQTGCVHEWFGGDGEENGAAGAVSRRSWRAPVGMVLETARAVIETADSAPLCVWIGRRCWPNPVAMARASPTLLQRSIFVEPVGRDEKVWAIDLALRSGGAAAVIADASRLSLTESRRLQLAAEAGGALGLLLRPSWEMGELSAARTRWRLSPAISADSDQRWMVELLRCKGLRPSEGEARRWSVRRSHATGDVSVAPDAAHRSPQTEIVAPRRRAL